MRVLQAMAGAPIGGAEAFFVRLVLALHRAGLDQRVAIRRDARRAAALAEGGLVPVELSFGGIFDFATRRALAREIASWRPDVVLTWMSRATRHCPRATADRRFVHVARLGGYYDLKYYRRCDHLVANTLDIAAYATGRGWPEARVHYLPNFVDAAPAAPVTRASLSTPEGAPLILALGRLHPNKALDVAIRALAKLPEAYLWIAGAGPLADRLRAEAHAAGVADRVRFLGWRDDTPALLAACDVLVCPSRVEPLGNVIIEAWANGVPVVAADAVGPRRLIAEGESGLLVPVDDPAALAAAVARVIAEPGLAQQLVAGGHAAWQHDFTEAAVLRAWLDFFARVAG